MSQVKTEPLQSRLSGRVAAVFRSRRGGSSAAQRPQAAGFRHATARLPSTGRRFLESHPAGLRLREGKADPIGIGPPCSRTSRSLEVPLVPSGPGRGRETAARMGAGRSAGRLPPTPGWSRTKGAERPAIRGAGAQDGAGAASCGCRFCHFPREFCRNGGGRGRCFAAPPRWVCPAPGMALPAAGQGLPVQRRRSRRLDIGWKATPTWASQ